MFNFPVAAVVPFDLNSCYVFDFTASGDLEGVDLSDTSYFTRFVFDILHQNEVPVGIGRYNEDRIIYQRSGLFGTERSIHLGVDIFAAAGTPIFAPLAGRVHSFQNNDNFGDYGPTIILEHNVDGEIFYTLYGHLSIDSIRNLRVGQSFNAGETLGYMGDDSENGNWPPHLHFQIITDMQGMRGDFPGVCSYADRDRMLSICPDPNLILRIVLS